MNTELCDHGVLQFGSGDYYIFCRKCSRTWVLTGPKWGDQPDPNNIQVGFHSNKEWGPK